MKDSKLLLGNFDTLWGKYSKRLINCQQTGSEEAVHKLRISCRRLLAIMALLQALDPKSSFGKLRKQIKTQLDSFDELRDTQVMLIVITDSLNALADLADYHRYLKLNEQRLLAKIQDLFKNTQYADQQALFKKVRNKLSISPTLLTQPILAIIDNHYQIALTRHHVISADTPGSLHHLRIALKKLRYMISASKPFLPELPINHANHMQSYLTRLGEIQNSTVLLDSINRFFGHQPPDKVHARFESRHQSLLNDYFVHSHEITGFWRANPYQDFPWQQDKGISARPGRF